MYKYTICIFADTVNYVFQTNSLTDALEFYAKHRVN